MTNVMVRKMYGFTVKKCGFTLLDFMVFEAVGEVLKR